MAQTPAPLEPAPLAPAPEPEPAPLPEPTLSAEPAPLEVQTEPIPSEAHPAEVEAEAEEEAEGPPTSIAGYVEAGYHLNLSKKFPFPVALRTYDSWNGNTFLLHAAHLAFSHSFSDEVSAVVEIDAGSDPAITSGASLPVDLGDEVILGGAVYAFDVQEGYAKYSKGGFSLTAGKFVTYAGIEVIEGPLNPTLTRGFLFGLAEAYTHVGLKAHYTAESGFDIGIGVVNGWDLWVDNNDWKTIIARIGYAGDKFFGGVSGSFGSESVDDKNPRLSLDLTGGVIAGPVTINFQGNFGSEDEASWYGFGVQPIYNGGVFTLGARVEYFADPDGVRTGLGAVGVTDASFVNLTLTPGFLLADAFALRFEVRADLAVGGEPTKDTLNGNSGQVTLGAGASYSW